MASELEKTYQPGDVEAQVAGRWAASGAFHAEPEEPGGPSGGGTAYSIVIPPPNVTAALHLGHALNNTLQDVLIRHHRMLGCNTVWLPGTDHAGIATQTVVDKRLQQEGQASLKDYKELERECKHGREQFIEKVQAWKDEYEARITDQLKQMGCSCDWERQRFTMDPICAKAVREAFFQLFKDGLIYRGKRLVNWDPVTQTALADDEVEMREVDGSFWYLKYPLAEPASAGVPQYVTVATTRPETMLGDTAVAVNPRDPKHAGMIGKFVKLPIVGRVIPIIGDDHVTIADADSDDAKAKYASGYLKVTPAHDPNDWEIGRRHNLDVINIMAPDGSISDQHGWADKEQISEESRAFLGLSREDARKQIVRWFKDHDLLDDVKPYRHSVGHSYRSHAAIEPYLSDQWYVAVNQPTERLGGKSLAQAALDALSDSERAASVSERKPQQFYFLTFTCYGTWLRGDDRGSVDLDHNLPGTPYLIGDEAGERREFDRLKQSAVQLDEAQRQAVHDAICGVCEHRGWRLMALHVRTRHVHVVVAADVPPEKVMGDFKAYATRRLREKSLVAEDQRVWTRHGSTRYLNDEDAIHGAAHYTIDEQGEALRPPPYDGFRSLTVAAREEPLPHGRGSLEDTASSRSRLVFTPERYAKTFETWHENIRDWCISRQLWWGHRIPVWSMPASLEGYAGTFSDQREIDSFVWSIFESKTFTKSELERIAFQIGGGTSGNIDAHVYACVPPGESDIEAKLVTEGFTRDPDVLDTWFSSALWPLSTMGWPEDTAELRTWNPTSVLCTAREIITLWVSRMVMFNLYLRGCLPFGDVFIHAMIQDGHGQKMSKSLGNGVDPIDIIHSHGADAMRFTLASMATHTQDVRLPVDMVCPHTGERFTPKYITTSEGTKVAAPIQECPNGSGRKMVSYYGYVSGLATPNEEMPLARNTSEKFDLGQRFANKLWNAVRFALGNLETSERAATVRERSDQLASLADQWILARLARTVRAADNALREYQFAVYVESLYDFFWRDLCDWYIEIIKPTVKQNATQRAVLATCLDAALRLLHPVMPFITERLWERLNEVSPKRGEATGVRGLEGVMLPSSELLITAAWPKVDSGLLIDEKVEKTFDLMQRIVGAIREVRTAHKVPPRQIVEVSAKASAANSQMLLAHRHIVATLANMGGGELGPRVQPPENAASVRVGDIELYIHGLADDDTERARLEKRAEELSQSITRLRGRLSNESYTSKAPAKLVQETRDQLAAAEREVQTLHERLGDG